MGFLQKWFAQVHDNTTVKLIEKRQYLLPYWLDKGFKGIAIFVRRAIWNYAYSPFK